MKSKQTSHTVTNALLVGR